jgi:hypothetical protein
LPQQEQQVGNTGKSSGTESVSEKGPKEGDIMSADGFGYTRYHNGKWVYIEGSQDLSIYGTLPNMGKSGVKLPETGAPSIKIKEPTIRYRMPNFRMPVFRLAW